MVERLLALFISLLPPVFRCGPELTLMAGAHARHWEGASTAPFHASPRKRQVAPAKPALERRWIQWLARGNLRQGSQSIVNSLVTSIRRWEREDWR
jgi:hypothetical protein